METVAEEMRTLIDRGEGLSTESATFARFAIKAALQRVRMPMEYVMPSLESFDNSGVSATVVTLEGVEDAIKVIRKKLRTM